MYSAASFHFVLFFCGNSCLEVTMGYGGGGGVRRRLKGFRGVAGDYKGVEGVTKG